MASPSDAPAATPPDIQTMTLPDGRTLEYALYGFSSPDSASRPTIFHFHGYPGAHQEARMFAALALAKGARYVAPTRPGMGRSTFQPGRGVLSWPSDVCSLADHLGVDRFAVIGVSAGGPYALATWHTLSKERVVGCALVCSMYPASLGMGGMLFAARAMIFLGSWAPSVLGWGMDLTMGKVARHEDRARLGAEVDKMMRDESRPEADRKVWEENRGGIRDALVDALRDAVSPGGQGSAWEARLLGAEWGFRLEDVDVARKDGEGRETGGSRVVLWHGTLDVNVPFAMAEKAAARMPGVELRVCEGEAHASLAVNKTEEILDTILGMFTAS